MKGKARARGTREGWMQGGRRKGSERAFKVVEEGDDPPNWDIRACTGA